MVTGIAIALAAIGLLGVFVVAVMAFAVTRAIHDADRPAPRCAADPTALTWAVDDPGWRRSDRFELNAPSQVVQIDARLRGDSGRGILAGWATIYAVRAGTTAADVRALYSSQTATSTGPVRPEVDSTDIVKVGMGLNAVNEQVTLGAGTWELMSDDFVKATTVRSPC